MERLPPMLQGSGRPVAWPAGAAAMRAQAARRLALLLDPCPDEVRGPPVARLVGELAVLRDAFARKSREVERAGNPRPVMLLPGFLTHPVRMRFMRRSLESAGHKVHDWGLGFNLGPNEERICHLTSRVSALCARHGEPVALVGWSLGGLFAREIAWRVPDAVALVATMGSPFSGDRHANNAWRIYQAVTGHRVEDAPASRDPADKPPVPTVALWSARDGIVAPRSARGRGQERDAAIALRCTHLGFAYSPEAIAAVLRVLDDF